MRLGIGLINAYKLIFNQKPTTSIKCYWSKTWIQALKVLYPSKYTFFKLDIQDINAKFKEPIKYIEQQFIKEEITLLN